LAIIPSLLVSDGGERFAIPQVSVGELIRIPVAQLAERTDRVGDAEVLNVRDRLVPLLHLSDALGVPRRKSAAKALNVVLVDTGAFEYGLVVEELHDTVEIVVKPLGRHMKGLHDYAGATILGDGHVALILDVAGLATRAKLTAGTVEAGNRREAEDSGAAGEMHSLLVFHNAPPETCAVPIEQVSRIERVRPAQILQLGGRRTMQYCGASLPLVALHDTAAVGEPTAEQQLVVIVFERLGRPLGLLAAEPLDMVEVALNIDAVTLRQRGIVPIATVRADNQCNFGKWLYGPEISGGEKQTPQYQDLRQRHAEFHEQASKVAQLAMAGQREAADKALSGDFSVASSSLMTLCRN
jgi:two-component system chemotaxis sensor kinase CheA